MHVLLLAASLTITALTAAAAPFGGQDHFEPVARPSVDTPKVFLDLETLTTVSTARPDTAMGHEVALRGLRVDQLDTRGFWVTADAVRGRLFVFPAEGELIEVEPGDVVNIHGDIRVTPEHWRGQQANMAGSELLIYAYTVRPARATR